MCIRDRLEVLWQAEHFWTQEGLQDWFADQLQELYDYVDPRTKSGSAFSATKTDEPLNDLRFRVSAMGEKKRLGDDDGAATGACGGGSSGPVDGRGSVRALLGCATVPAVGASWRWQLGCHGSSSGCGRGSLAPAP